jgi:ADP-heptose:LPS heptosyltransferase
MAATPTCSVAKAGADRFVRSYRAVRFAADLFRSALRPAPSRHGREVFLNHVWESLNAGAKILFFAVVTPIMLAAWGKEQFGLFAVANSCVALMGFLDLGLRMSTRVGLTNPRLAETAKVQLHARNFAAFALAALAGVGAVGLLALTGCWHRWLNLLPSGDVVIAVTAALTAVTMGLQLLAERIAAAGRLSRIKAALFIANLLAFVIVIALLNDGASVTTVTTAYFAALTLPLFFLLPRANLHLANFARALVRLRSPDILSALRGGGWINLLTAAWFFQSYGLVFLISWLSGPAAAGTFFLFLKMAELLGVLGASASEPTIVALAGAPTSLDRHRHFAASYKSAIALCLTGAVGYTFFCSDLFRIWLHQSLDHSYSGLLIGLFGVATGFSRMVTAASVGLGKSRTGALGLLAGTIFLGAAIALFHGHGGLETILAVGCASALFLLPTAVVIAREIGANFAKIWIRPVVSFAPQLTLIILVCWAAARTGSLSLAGIAALFSAAICAQYIFRSPAKPQRTNDSLLGYDTRSWRSALVMKGVDLLNPFRRAEKFAWSGPCVVSSIAGLGDLFVHLPLIAGILNEARRQGIAAHVALRPAHVVIGHACGWNVVPFDHALEDFFKRPFAIDPAKLVRQIVETRRCKTNLWIDLTGSAVSALAIKCAGARNIAARITRGGRSLINYRLPHALHENEYGNVERVAAMLGCELDYSVFDRLRGAPLPGLQDKVVLCLTTVCRWRNWPLENFLALVDRFPETQFAATGLAAEVAPEEHGVFDILLRRRNVVSLVDTMSILDLIRLIAHARAVITNDTSTAHVANAFRKPGAVLFGPASPDKLAAPYGLKSFVDRTCPFHPCVQWTCHNQENWCMRKVQVGPVAHHLATVLGATAPYAATASVG